MEEILKSILKKLDTIEGRLTAVESQEPIITAKKKVEVKQPIRNLLFDKAVKIIQDYDEVPTTLMQQKLGVDFKKAEQILEQLASAGYGETYMGEA